VLRVNGPFVWYADLFPPPVGFRWKSYTAITHNVFYLVGGGRVALPLPYLVALPPVGKELPWEHWRRMDMMLEDDTNNQKPDKWVPSSEPLLVPFPTIHQYCTDCWTMKDKKAVPRTPCTIGLTFFSGAVNLTLNDKGRSRSVHTTAATVQEALELLEGHLVAHTAPWRTWKN